MILYAYKLRRCIFEMKLAEPDICCKKQYEEMMTEWEEAGGRLNPGALRRWSKSQNKKVDYEEWLSWIKDDKAHGQELYFFTDDNNRIYRAVSIRPKKNAASIGLDGRCGFGIRPSERRKGYASQMLSMALPIMKSHGINPVIITCDKDNIGSAKTIINNRGILVKEVKSENDGNFVQVYEILI